MTETMSRLPENLTTSSWNPALRPEDAPEAPVAESIPAPTVESQSPNEEPSADITTPDITTTEEELIDSRDRATDEPIDTAALADEHTDPNAPSEATTDTLPEENKPDEINWGEETGVSWDLQAQDPFSREDVVGRTNSFPPVENMLETIEDEPLASEHPNAPETHPELQVEEQGETLPVSQPDLGESNNNFWGTSDDIEDEEDEFFGQLKTQTKPIYVPPEAESRFEEGVPLVESESYSQPEIADQNEPQLDNVFGDDDTDDFFASTTAADASKSQIPAVTRKSTYDVLGSLNAGIPDSPVENPNAALGVGDEEDLAARWEAELDDDDLLLEDDSLNQTQAQVQEPEEVGLPNGASAADSWPQHGVSQPASTSNYANPYAPHQPSSSELFQLPNAYAPVSIPPASPFGALQNQPHNELAAKSQSFVDQAREGYKSPYDLPESLGRSRRPAAPRKAVTPPPLTTMGPPPRTSSIPISTPVVNPTPSQPDALPSASSATSAPKNFFEELPPPAPKPRPASRTSGYTPSPAVVSNAPVANAPPIVPLSVPPPLPLVQPATDNVYQDQLQSPERIGLYANLTVPAPPAGPGVGPRYSPKPPSATTSKSPVYSRYSPAPPSSQAPSNVRPRYVSQPSNLPFQPRTSSPLAHHEKTAYDAQQRQSRPSTSAGPSSLAHPMSTNHVRGSFSVPSTQLATETGDHAPLDIQPSAPAVSAQQNPYAPGFSSEPSRRSSTESPYLPSTGVAQPQIPSIPSDISFAPPRRSQTQSPGKQLFGVNPIRNTIEPVQRPASVHAPSSPTKTSNAYTTPSVVSATREIPELNFIPPADGRELDPLQRWKGAPVFKFGFGGLVSSCFPQHIPRYIAGQMTPMIQPAPGEAKVRQFKQVLPLDGDIVQYPGPLKSKSKKKDLIAWLSSRIAALENEGMPSSLHLEPDGYKRHDENILLWKLLRILVENDGVLEGTDDIRKSLRSIISPELESTNQDYTFDSRTASGSYQPTDGSLSPEPISSNLLGLIKNDLLVGDREKAVWRAVDNRLWGHAMIMSSTLDKALWKQVAQEFVRREVRPAGENVESLSALYAVVSGNIDESIDELVPASARLGLQMISKEGQGISKNAVDGLDRWRETLGLILNNRSADDHQALSAMGQLLASYGRIEASHVCYLFAKAFSQRPIINGADDPQTSVVLLGTDHLKYPTTFFRDEDAIALTEVYEYATSVLAGNTAAALPYLQPFKLQHAYILADKGFRSEALQYCEAIGSVLKASTKPSLYFHQRLFAELDELATRLKQAPGDGNSSWMSKPSMEKVSGTMWARFSSFVAGDESDGASNGSAMDVDVGPFAKVTEAATISRPPSVSDMYGSYPAAQPASNSFSRYAPANQFAPSSSPEQYRGRSSMESQRSPSIGMNYSQRRGSQEPATPVDPASPYNFASNNYGSPTSFPFHSTPPQSSYVPLAPVEEDLPTSPQPYPAAPQQSALTSGLQASPERFGQPLTALKDGPAEAVIPSYGGYEPPSMSSYQPPSYEPDFGVATDGLAQEEDINEESKPKKKSFMDDEDEDDLATRAAAVQKTEKARRDREADDAVRKAAEADGMFFLIQLLLIDLVC
jgi:COPII coat assembly protein SEC16